MWSLSPLEEKCLPAVPVGIKKANLKPLGSMNSENPLFSKCGSMVNRLRQKFVINETSFVVMTVWELARKFIINDLQQWKQPAHPVLYTCHNLGLGSNLLPLE